MIERRLQAWWNVSPRWRLAVALGLAVVLLAVGVVIGVVNDRLYAEQKLRQANVQAEILAGSVTAALAFDDRASAQEYVNALRANPEVRAVTVMNERGEPVASFVRPGTPPSNQIRVEKPVSQSGVALGRVRISTDAEPTTRRLTRYGLTALLIAMAALIVAVFGFAQVALARVNRVLAERARQLSEANRKLTVEMAERTRAEEALRQSQKMEAMGQLTGGVAHDFNNLLMVASSGLDLLDRTDDPARRDKLKAGIRQAVDRGKSLTKQLLAFSRRSTLNPEVVDLGAKIEGMRLLLDRSLRENIQVRLDLAEDLWPVEIDPSQLELAILNVAVNARDAMPDGGRLTIETANTELDAGYAATDAEVVPGQYVMIAVSDSGQGMDPDTVTRAFEPFFTTKDVGKGTGLGLSMVYEIGRAHV